MIMIRAAKLKHRIARYAPRKTMGNERDHPADVYDERLVNGRDEGRQPRLAPPPFPFCCPAFPAACCCCAPTPPPLPLLGDGDGCAAGCPTSSTPAKPLAIRPTNNALSFSTFFRSACWSVLYCRHWWKRRRGRAKRERRHAQGCVVRCARPSVVRHFQHQLAVRVSVLAAKARLQKRVSASQASVNKCSPATAPHGTAPPRLAKTRQRPRCTWRQLQEDAQTKGAVQGQHANLVSILLCER